MTRHSQEIKDDFEALEGQQVSIAGRVMSKRIMGKASLTRGQSRRLSPCRLQSVFSDTIPEKCAASHLRPAHCNGSQRVSEAKKLADEKGVHYEDRHKKGDILNLFFEEYVEEHLVQPTFMAFFSCPFSRLFMVGKSSTSRIAGEFVSSITSLSMPYPIPPVGGIPISSAFMKSSSVV